MFECNLRLSNVVVSECESVGYSCKETANIWQSKPVSGMSKKRRKLKTRCVPSPGSRVVELYSTENPPNRVYGELKRRGESPFDHGVTQFTTSGGVVKLERHNAYS